MGWSIKRVGKTGKPRYTAQYRDLRGEKQTIGTFSNKKGKPTEPGNEPRSSWPRGE
ncbi:hypothetical protein HNP84_005960 [Thermocatellispora tengchongensis]|uniref:Integrase n=1 Tax=Thermocatellispora tengchongensis TaxID=1073253 RepID=A0A840PC04_9ACTN|nr:hypothetical protein [Thermocatellispora tengchongensis]MBB5136216.1 hypothetical protein [Thermocatellispora tengchongensis]